MGAAFDHVAFFQDVDAVRIHDLDEAVGDDDHRTALFDGVERVLICLVAMASRLAVGSSRKMMGGF